MVPRLQSAPMAVPGIGKSGLPFPIPEISDVYLCALLCPRVSPGSTTHCLELVNVLAWVAILAHGALLFHGCAAELARVRASIG